MASIRPFKALRPLPEYAAKLASVPYDVVSTREARSLAEGNRYSFLHVVRPEIDLPDSVDIHDDAVYEKAAENFSALKTEGVLVQENEASLYIYRLEMDGREQIGIAGCCLVDEYDNDTIKKHEFTRKAKEDDRVRHMLTLRAHAGPVLLTYRRTEPLARLLEQESSGTPLFDFTAVDGIRHTIWRCENPAQIQEAFREVPSLYIADGHHRAAGASRVKAHMLAQGISADGSEEFSSFLTVIFPSDQLNIFAYNKYVRDLGEKTPGELLSALKADFLVTPAGGGYPEARGEIHMYLESSWYRLAFKNPQTDSTDPVSALDLSRFEKLLLEPILGIEDQRSSQRIDFEGGIGSPEKLAERVDREGGTAFTFYPVSVEELMRVSDAGMVMPPKSTWFAPKLRSGLLVHEF
ncbi:hypothetical protein B4O97_06845 [Marispirochaeta aestuarii]|uniref:DUF1015 domain-containing protein n=1 Tax=Marispirochaeta aestuarii TaxID=1963862 RepID=A0A1Y1S0W7_9SPIO|nr:DUF1015 domain-containing protein [Marispirochaeta aestuarii]ORC36300.1 hypothetical protein B4O97_06845 [Marispirochaeta aestuarii]